MLLFEQVRQVFPDGTTALRDFSAEVRPGEFCVLLGSSGAGKSTLLKCVNGLVRPSAGRIALGGQELGPRTLPALRRQVAMIHQHFNLVARLSVEANVLCGAAAHLPWWRVMSGVHSPEWRRRAAAVVEQVGLGPEHFSRRAAELSGGQQQRVGIARAFLLNPPVVLADEPVASLDPRTGAEILALLRTAAKERGTTVLCSLHQLEWARQFADRILGMRDGRLVFDGPPGDLGEGDVQTIYRREVA